jgi:AhpD family alkylhydroperoxidase
MTSYLRYEELPRDLYEAMQAPDKVSKAGGLSSTLLGLIRVRVSQINKCAFCIDMHVKEALASGESFQRLYSLSAWRETSYYSAKERATLDWTEAITLISEQGIPDRVNDEIMAQFDGPTIARLTLAVIAINGWNRLMLSIKREPGGYKPGFDFRNPVAGAQVS